MPCALYEWSASSSRRTEFAGIASLPGPYVFLVTDWAGRDVALEERQWTHHILRRRQWNDDRMIPLIRQTIQDPDVAYVSERSAQRVELWRRFTDVKDGSPGLLHVIVEYDGLVQQASSGDVITAMVAIEVDSKGARLWTRP